MAQWSSSDSGILRKTQTIENHEELLIFGYACKLFRDDEKALYIDQSKHLIPWMGEDSLKIDRLGSYQNKLFQINTNSVSGTTVEEPCLI